MQELKRLIISCGGTGGHFNPGLSTACSFRDAGGQVLLILGGKHFDEQLKTASSNGIEYRRVSCAPLAKNPSGAWRLPPFAGGVVGLKEMQLLRVWGDRHLVKEPLILLHALDPIQAVETLVGFPAPFQSLIPHGRGAHPHPALSIQRPVDDHRLLGL